MKLPEIPEGLATVDSTPKQDIDPADWDPSGAHPDTGDSLREATDYEAVIRNSVARYINRHPNGDPREHLVDICPVLGAMSPNRQFAVTDGKQFLYYRGSGSFHLDLESGMVFPELPELDPIRNCLRSGRVESVWLPHHLREGGLEVVALPIPSLEEMASGCFVVFELVDGESREGLDQHKQLVSKLAALHQFDASLELMGSEADLYERAVQAGASILGYEYCAILLHDESSEQLVLKYSNGYGEELHQMGIPLRREQGISVHSFRHNRIISVPEVENDPRYVRGNDTVRSELSIPVVLGRRPIGVFNAASSRPAAFSEEEVRLCVTLVHQLSLALERLRLFVQVGASRDVLIFALARLAESRDDDTGGHLERICGYTRIIAEALRKHDRFRRIVDEQYIEDLYRSSALHDIGKVGIPDAILQKPGRLTADEFEVMKTHTVIGGETLADAEKRIENLELLRMGKAIAYYPHEQWDGTGYPYGLGGEEIPVCARIVGLADVYDALTTKRCYKDAFSHEVARKYITKAVGKHFDPEVVAAFLESESEILTIKKRNAA